MNEQRIDEIIEDLLELGAQQTRIYSEEHSRNIQIEIELLRQELKSCLRKNK